MRISAQGCMQIPGNVLRVRQRPCRAASRSGGWGGVTSLCARSRGEPSSARCEQRLSDGSPLARAIPCAPAPECGETRKRERQPGFFVCTSTRSAACRTGMAGWAGEGGGRFGERREYEAPTLPSTPRQHGAACHYKSLASNSTPPQKPGQKRHAPHMSPELPPHGNTKKQQ